MSPPWTSKYPPGSTSQVIALRHQRRHEAAVRARIAALVLDLSAETAVKGQRCPLQVDRPGYRNSSPAAVSGRTGLVPGDERCEAGGGLSVARAVTKAARALAAPLDGAVLVVIDTYLSRMAGRSHGRR